MAEPEQPEQMPESERKRAVLHALAVSPQEANAWRELFLLYWPRVLAAIYPRVNGNRTVAQDLGQDVFVRLARYVDFRRFKQTEDFERYLLGMCRLAVITAFRRSARTVSMDETQLSVVAQQSVPSSQVADFWEEIRPVYRKLTAQESELFDLLVQEASQEEIAVQMDITASNVGVRIHRLREKLRQMLKRQEDADRNSPGSAGTGAKDK